MRIHYNPNLKQLARELRKNMTLAEVILWKQLRGNQVMGYSFLRQKPINNFIADFYCHTLRLVIEVDGYSHQFAEVSEKDQVKEARFQALGLTVLRFSDAQVIHETQQVLWSIGQYILDFEERQKSNQ